MKLSRIFITLIMILYAFSVQGDTITLKSGDTLENVKTRTEGNTIIITGKEQEILRIKTTRILKRSLGPKKRPNYALRAIAWPGWGEYKRNPNDSLGKIIMGGFGFLGLSGIYGAQMHFAAKKKANDPGVQTMINFGLSKLFTDNAPTGLTLAGELGKLHYKPFEKERYKYGVIANLSSLLMAVIYTWNLFRVGVFNSRKKKLRSSIKPQRIFFGLGTNQYKQNVIKVGIRF